MRDLGAWEVWWHQEWNGRRQNVNFQDLQAHLWWRFHTSMMRFGSSQGCGRSSLPKGTVQKSIHHRSQSRFWTGRLGFIQFCNKGKDIWHPGNISASKTCCVEMRCFYQPYIGVFYSSWKQRGTERPISWPRLFWKELYINRHHSQKNALSGKLLGLVLRRIAHFREKLVEQSMLDPFGLAHVIILSSNSKLNSPTLQTYQLGCALQPTSISVSENVPPVTCPRNSQRIQNTRDIAEILVSVTPAKTHHGMLIALVPNVQGQLPPGKTIIFVNGFGSNMEGTQKCFDFFTGSSSSLQTSNLLAPPSKFKIIPLLFLFTHHPPWN